MAEQALSLEDVVCNLMVEQGPESVLYFGESVPAALSGTPPGEFRHLPLSADTVEQWIETASSLHAALIFVELPPVGDRKQAFETLLGCLRNQLNARICVFVTQSNEWDFQDFIALGFKRLLDCHRGSSQVRCFSYAIASYNHIRSWNNARFWANPEMFDKYRW